jgi:cytochrome c oxidase subunit 2
MMKMLLNRWAALLSAAVLLAPFSLCAETRSENLWWLPRNVAVAGREIDGLFYFIFWLTTAVFIGVNAFMIYYMVKYRAKRGVKAHYTHGNNTVEVIWTTIPAVIFIGLVIYSNRLWSDFHRPAPENSLTVEVLAYQYGWDMRYPGLDDKLGQFAIKAMDPLKNKWGLDTSDPAAADDFEAAEFVVPIHRPVHLHLVSKDVIHAFYVPSFRVYQDLVPGRTISWLWFEATDTGNFQICCSQLCGAGHYNMKADIKVLAPEEFAKWYEAKSKKTILAQMVDPVTGQPRETVKLAAHGL